MRLYRVLLGFARIDWGYVGYIRFFSGLYWPLLGSNLVKVTFIGFYETLLGFAWLNWVVLVSLWVSLDFVRLNTVEMGSNLDLIGFGTGFNRVGLGWTGFGWVALGSTGFLGGDWPRKGRISLPMERRRGSPLAGGSLCKKKSIAAPMPMPRRAHRRMKKRFDGRKKK